MYEEDNTTKKSEMQNEINTLKRQLELSQKTNESQNQKIQRLNMERWSKLIPKVAAKCHEMLDGHIRGMYKNLTFVHVDEAGFWFSYELLDSTRQTYAVRHEEVE